MQANGREHGRPRPSYGTNKFGQQVLRLEGKQTRLLVWLKFLQLSRSFHCMVLLSKRRKVGGLAAAVILCVAGKLGFDQVRTMPPSGVPIAQHNHVFLPPYFPSIAVECVARTLLGNNFSETHVSAECNSSFTPGAPTLVTTRDRMIYLIFDRWKKLKNGAYPASSYPQAHMQHTRLGKHPRRRSLRSDLGSKVG